jgi:hypothetical protein
MECSGNNKKKDKAKIDILEKNNFICHASANTMNPQFLRKVWKKRKGNIPTQNSIEENNDPTSNNCMCVHKSFTPSSKYKNII